MTEIQPSSRHFPFYLAVVAAVVASAASAWLQPRYAVEAGANAFFVVYLGLTFARLPKLTAAYLRKNAAGADEPVWVIFAVTFAAVVVAVGSLFLLINGTPPRGTLEIALSLASVALGWFTIHTMTAIHYAHRYWRPDDESKPATKRSPHGGLEFPGTKDPNGFDFLYFALVIGMTAQTSDVEISSQAMRKINTLHAVVSFFFNTVLVAAAVNLAVSLGH